MNTKNEKAVKIIIKIEHNKKKVTFKLQSTDTFFLFNFSFKDRNSSSFDISSQLVLESYKIIVKINHVIRKHNKKIYKSLASLYKKKEKKIKTEILTSLSEITSSFSELLESEEVESTKISSLSFA